MSIQPGDLLTPDNVSQLGVGSVAEFGDEGAKVKIKKIAPDTWQSEYHSIYTDAEVGETDDAYPVTVVAAVPS